MSMRIVIWIQLSLNPSITLEEIIVKENGICRANLDSHLLIIRKQGEIKLVLRK